MTDNVSFRKLMTLSGVIVLSVLLIDQGVKFWVKTHMYLGEEYRIFGHWFYIHFTENYGMAFGLEFGGSAGKIFLSLFRIVASVVIAWYIVHLARHKSHPGMVACFSFIFAGAVGNIIDSLFYGVIFSDSMEGVAQLFPPDGGYAGFLHGRVVDMLYFPLFHGVFPDWLPIWGGESFQFFRPIFNIADSSITVGVIIYILFHNRITRHQSAETPVVSEPSPAADAS